MSAPTLRERRFRVLVVDDDPLMRLICATNLRCDGFDVIEAENGEEGFERALAEAPDLVLLDVAMPVLDGHELAAALRSDERTRQLPVVFLSGETDAASRARAEEVCARGYLAKPFDPAEVTAFIVEVLEQTATPVSH